MATRNKNVRSASGQAPKPAQVSKPAQAPKPIPFGGYKTRKDADDQGFVESLYGWVKNNWSNPLLSPGELEAQRQSWGTADAPRKR